MKVTITPSETKLSSLSPGQSSILWIAVFLTNASQRELVINTSSGLCYTSVGFPRGFVLSLQLFSLYTYDYVPTQLDCHILKYANVTVL